MNNFALSCLVTAFLTLILGFFVVTHKGKLNKLWFRCSVSIFLWTIGLFGSVYFDSSSLALMSQRILYIGTILLIPTFTHYIFFLTERKSIKNKKFIFLTYFLFFIFLFLSFTKYFILNIGERNSFGYWPVDTGNLYIVFLAFFIFFMILNLYLLLKSFQSAQGYKRKQLQYMFYAALIGFFGGSSNFLLDFNLNAYPIGNFFVSIYAIIMTYTIVKYRLMDIRLVISKSILYFLLTGSVAIVFTSITFFTAEFLSTSSTGSQLITTLVVSIIIVIGLDPLKRFLSNITDKIFYRGKINYQDVLRKLSEITAKEINLEKLLIDLSHNIEKLLKYKGVDFLYKSNSSGIYRGIINNNVIVTGQEEIVKYLNNTKGTIVVEELEIKLREETKEKKKYLLSLVRHLRKMNIGLIAPIISENEIIAFLIVNKKKSDDVFSGEDLNLISVVIPQIANALEKAKLYNEVQEFNVKLQEKVDKATEDLKNVNIDLETRNQYLIALQKVSSTISRSMDFTEVVQFIADSIQSEIGFQGGVVNFINEEEKSIYIGAMTKNEVINQAVKILPQNPFDYKVLLTEKNNLAVKSIITGEIQKSNKVYDLFRPAIDEKIGEVLQKTLNIKSAISVPIYSENKIIGSIDFFIKKQVKEIKAIDIEVMKSLADQTGLVIGNIRLYKQIREKNVALKQANVHLKKLDEAKSEFLSIASHQLRTPLTGIKGYLSMILEGDYGKIGLKQKKIIKDAFNASDRMSRLINVFLNVSRIESGHLKLDYTNLDLTKLIQECVKDLKTAAQDRGLNLKFITSKSEIPMISADSDKIKDVVLNLIDNAIKYTPRGGIEVSLFLKEKDKVLVRVKDTGMGLDQKGIDKLFNKFSRGEGISKINTSGSGLGLYIVRRIIEEHGGKVWVESDGPGKGSVFQFTLPIKQK